MKGRIIIFDKDQRSNEHLRGILMPNFEITAAPTLDEFQARLEASEYDVAICEFMALRQAEVDVPSLARSLQPKIRLVLITDLDSERYISALKKWRCRYVLPKLPFYNARDVTIFLENVIWPEMAFGLKRYLSDDAECRKVRIRNRREKNEIVEDIINYFASCEYEIHELYDVRLIMEEAINNALFHAFTTQDGDEIYNPEDFELLKDEDEVWLEYGADATTIGFSVDDNRGALTPEVIIDKLSRQYNREGLLDESGRGLYLSRMLSGRIVFNIKENVRTQVVTIFYEKRLNVPKPFSINYIPQDETP